MYRCVYKDKSGQGMHTQKSTMHMNWKSHEKQTILIGILPNLAIYNAHALRVLGLES
jgi:hypothetical protein